MSAVNAITGNEYSGVNAQTLGSGKYATFNQWRKHGYMVRKGEHGTRIMNRLGKDEDGKVKFTGYSVVFEMKQVDKVGEDSEDSTPTPEPKDTKRNLSKGALRKVASQMSGSYRLIHLKYGSEDWSTDGYTAINTLVQPTKKGCKVEVHEDKDLAPLVDGHDKYLLGTRTTEEEHGTEYTTLVAVNTPLQVKVNAKWFENLGNLYPQAKVKLTGELTPVLFEEDNKLVAVIMPVRSK